MLAPFYLCGAETEMLSPKFSKILQHVPIFKHMISWIDFSGTTCVLKHVPNFKYLFELGPTQRNTDSVAKAGTGPDFLIPGSVL